MRRLLVAVLGQTMVPSSMAVPVLACGPHGWSHVGVGSTTPAHALNQTVDALATGAAGMLSVGGTFADAGGKGQGGGTRRVEATSPGSGPDAVKVSIKAVDGERPGGPR